MHLSACQKVKFISPPFQLFSSDLNEYKMLIAPGDVGQMDFHAYATTIQSGYSNTTRSQNAFFAAELTRQYDG